MAGIGKVKYVGKCLLINIGRNAGRKKILAVGDLHLGYEEAMNVAGMLMTREMYDMIIGDFDKIFKKISKGGKDNMLINNKSVERVNNKSINNYDKVINGEYGEIGLGDNKDVLNGNSSSEGSDNYGISNDDSYGLVRSKKIVDEIVILGDIKHEFGRINKQEWNEIIKLFEYLAEKCKRIVIIKGNHDKIIEPIARKRGVSVKDFYILNDVCFMHGDRDFKNIEKIYNKKIKCWIIGHAHPAVALREGRRVEKYKCFLTGKYKGKQIFVMPSFFPLVEGVDVKAGYEAGDELGLAWKFKLGKFRVKVVGDDVGDNLEAREFGELGKLRG